MEFGWIIVIVIVVVVIYCMSRRRSRTEDLPEDCAGMWLSGRVTGISDGDGFRFFDCPWFRSTHYTSEDDRLYIRLAGIDAPEMGKSNKPGQPFAVESKDHLRYLTQGKIIKIKVVGKDQYNRVLAFAYVPGFLPTFFLDNFLPLEWFYTNVNLEMVKSGYACVYRGRDAIYDGYKETLVNLEIEAKNGMRGMWIKDKKRKKLKDFYCKYNFIVRVRFLADELIRLRHKVTILTISSEQNC